MRKTLFAALLLSSLAASASPAAADPAPEAALARTHDDASLQWGPCPGFMPAGCGIAVLHGDPGKANSDVFLKVPGGSSIPKHWHTSAERMVLVSGTLSVTYDGHPASTLRPGSYAYGPAKLPHEAVCAAGDPCVLFIAFELPVDAVEVGTQP
jgi:quercetin dioxygenase-like cupin family protein